MAPRLQTIEQWVGMLRETELPVLGRTVAELQLLQEDEAGATPARVAAVVLHDPFMTVKLLQYLQRHRSLRRSADITTIQHALMMLGLQPFFSHFSAQPALEDWLAADAASLHGVRTVMSRARHAALYARDWARLRHDVDPEEVMIAALLHDMAEMLLWCYAPRLAAEIAARQQHDPSLRSEHAQREVIGFRLLDLQLAMVKAWQLPDILRVLIDEEHAHNPRVTSVALAAAVARHSAHGWDDAALPDDYDGIGKLLLINSDEARARVIRVAHEAAVDESWYGVPPAAALLPPEPVEGPGNVDSNVDNSADGAAADSANAAAPGGFSPRQ
jgi:HD-like signal output (HDOD) protein